MRLRLQGREQNEKVPDNTNNHRDSGRNASPGTKRKSDPSGKLTIMILKQTC